MPRLVPVLIVKEFSVSIRHPFAVLYALLWTRYFWIFHLNVGPSPQVFWNLVVPGWGISYLPELIVIFTAIVFVASYWSLSLFARDNWFHTEDLVTLGLAGAQTTRVCRLLALILAGSIPTLPMIHLLNAKEALLEPLQVSLICLSLPMYCFGVGALLYLLAAGRISSTLVLLLVSYVSELAFVDLPSRAAGDGHWNLMDIWRLVLEASLTLVVPEVRELAPALKPFVLYRSVFLIFLMAMPFVLLLVPAWFKNSRVGRRIGLLSPALILSLGGLGVVGLGLYTAAVRRTFSDYIALEMFRQMQITEPDLYPTRGAITRVESFPGSEEEARSLLRDAADAPFPDTASVKVYGGNRGRDVLITVQLNFPQPLPGVLWLSPPEWASDIRCTEPPSAQCELKYGALRVAPVEGATTVGVIFQRSRVAFGPSGNLLWALGSPHSLVHYRSFIEMPVISGDLRSPRPEFSLLPNRIVPLPTRPNLIFPDEWAAAPLGMGQPRGLRAQRMWKEISSPLPVGDARKELQMSFAFSETGNAMRAVVLALICETPTSSDPVGIQCRHGWITSDLRGFSLRLRSYEPPASLHLLSNAKPTLIAGDGSPVRVVSFVPIPPVGKSRIEEIVNLFSKYVTSRGLPLKSSAVYEFSLASATTFAYRDWDSRLLPSLCETMTRSLRLEPDTDLGELPQRIHKWLICYDFLVAGAILPPTDAETAIREFIQHDGDDANLFLKALKVWKSRKRQ